MRRVRSVILAALIVATFAVTGTPAVAGSSPQVSISTVHGGFYPNPGDSGPLDLSQLSSPVFTEDFPVIDFNPPMSAQVSCSNNTGVNENTRPFTDVIPNADGTCSTLVAQGGGQQAGVGDLPGGLFAFQAIFTANLSVAAAGQVTFNFFSDDGWMLGAGQRQGGTDQPAYVSGSDLNPLTATPLRNYPVVGSFNTNSAPAQNQVTVSFPAAGTYPIELDYTECCGGQLALVLGTTFGNPIPPAGGAPVISSVTPNGGPASGGTSLVVGGTSFANGDALCFYSGSLLPGPPVVCASATTVVSPTQITAVTPALPALADAGRLYLGIQRCCSGLSLQNYLSTVAFFYFVPAIGTLVFRDPSLPPTSNDYFSYCTAEVVQSANQDVLLTAGHCLDSGSRAHDEVTFAPGYYGALCPVSGTTAGAVASDAFLCGTAPYGLWHERDAILNSGYVYQGQQGLDYGFVLLKTQFGTHIQLAVGGMALTFCPGQSFPLHPTCDAGSGATQAWTAYGQPDPSVGLQSCGPGSVGTVTLSQTGPDSLSLSPCTVLTGGASGGPWINSANAIGAVNKSVCAPSKCSGGELAGTYLGNEAKAGYDIAQHDSRGM